MMRFFPTLEAGGRLASRAALILAVIVLTLNIVPELSEIEGRVKPVRRGFAVTVAEQDGTTLRLSGTAEIVRTCQLYCLGAFIGNADEHDEADRAAVSGIETFAARRPDGPATTPGPVNWGPLEIDLPARRRGQDLWLRVMERCHGAWPTVSEYPVGRFSGLGDDAGFTATAAAHPADRPR